MLKAIVVLSVLALVNASPARDARDLVGTGIGTLGNIFWTKDMQLTGCKNHGYCNTELCLAGPRGGGGLFGMMGNAFAAATAVAAKDILSEETHKSSCIAAGMYDENLAPPQIRYVIQ